MNGRALRAHVRRGTLCTAFLLVALAAWPMAAAATPPTLRSVTVPLGGNHVTSTWTLPQGVRAQFIQVSESSEVDEDGYFRNLVNLEPVGQNDTSFSDPLAYENGVYYLHVAGRDPKCAGGVCPAIEFSEVMSFVVPGVGASAGPGGVITLPPTTGGPGPDRVKPLQVLTFPPVQDVDKLFVRAQMSEPGTLRASAKVSVPGASKVYAFKTASRAVGANVRTTLRLKLAKKRLKAVKRALRRGKKLKARVTVTATDKAGNRRAQKATIRLTR